MKKRIIKAIIIYIFVFFMVFSLSSCGEKVLKETSTFKIVSKVSYNRENEVIRMDKEELNVLNDFSYRTFKAIYDSTSKNNLIYSPASYYMALSMLTAGANNSTLNELLKFQGISTLDELKNINKALFNNNNYNNDGGKARIANSFWVHLNLELRDEYVNTIQNDYLAEGYKSLFDSEAAKNICQWINNNTFDFLNVQPSDIDLDEIVLLLINTIYFDNKWSTDYKKSATTKEKFYKNDGEVVASFMHHTVTNSYYETDKYQVASDSFYNGNKITYILPSEDYSVNELLQSDDFENIILGKVSYQYPEIVYSLPKFKYQNTLDLKEKSKPIGLTEIFDPSKCDLSKISDEKLYVDYIKQIAGIELSEEGVKAAAVTIIGDKCTSVGPTEMVYMNLNRPFIYYITDTTGSILFMGIINNPTK